MDKKCDFAPVCRVLCALIVWYCVLLGEIFVKYIGVTPFKQNLTAHTVWKWQKKSHSTSRAKRATFTFWEAKSSLKIPKMVVFENLKLLVKQCYQTGQLLLDKDWKKSNETLWVIFKHCVLVVEWGYGTCASACVKNATNWGSR